MLIKLLVEEPIRPDGYRILAYCPACKRLVGRLDGIRATPDNLGRPEHHGLPPEERVAAVDAARGATIHAYARRQQTVSEHQQRIGEYLRLRTFDTAAGERLARFLARIIQEGSDFGREARASVC